MKKKMFIMVDLLSLRYMETKSGYTKIILQDIIRGSRPYQVEDNTHNIIILFEWKRNK